MTCALQVHLMEWVRAVIATTLGVGPDQDLPPLIMQQETHSIWEQIRMSPLHACAALRAACTPAQRLLPVGANASMPSGCLLTST